MEQHTGHSAPPSELDGTLLDSSGSSSATAKAAPWKKHRATPAAPALVATFDNVSLHNANQINLSSGSEILSVASSSERQRRADLGKPSVSLPKPEPGDDLDRSNWKTTKKE